MLTSLSSNVILSKARAMYGRRLTEQNYHDLLACQSVSDVAHYLKANTAYEKILSGINESDVHRGQLESRLKQKVFEDSAALCRYELSTGEHFSEYILYRSEIEQIMHSLMLLNAGKPEEYIFAVPMFLNQHSRIDLPSLANVRSFDDVLNALNHTPYYKVLEPFRPMAGMNLDYTGIENALYTFLYQALYQIVRHYTKGEAKRQLCVLFDTMIDLYNYSRIIRLKTYFHASPDFIRSCLFPFGLLRKEQIDEMLLAENAESVQKIMAGTKTGRRVMKIKHTRLQELTNRATYLTCRHDIHFSTHPSVVMLSYFFLVQIEVTDIINIVEGIRYQLPPSDIEKLLTIVNFE